MEMKFRYNPSVSTIRTEYMFRHTIHLYELIVDLLVETQILQGPNELDLVEGFDDSEDLDGWLLAQGDVVFEADPWWSS